MTHSSPANAYPHVRAAFINAIAEEGTKAEAVEYLQKQWNETCALRAELKAIRINAQCAPWQPIETAPKDGRAFLACVGQWITTCCWNKHRHDWCSVSPGYASYADDEQPTHWMPLPVGPAFTSPGCGPICQSCKRPLALASLMGTHGLCCECVSGGFPLSSPERASGASSSGGSSHNAASIQPQRMPVDPTRCEVCDWPFAESRERGCVPGDCCYRPDTPAEQERIRKRRSALAHTRPKLCPTEKTDGSHS